MGDVYDQFELELSSLSRKYARNPRRQMIRLFLLALEREEIVSVGYHEELIGARLDTMPISEQERQIIRHALLWIWSRCSAIDRPSATSCLIGLIRRAGAQPFFSSSGATTVGVTKSRQSSPFPGS